MKKINVEKAKIRMLPSLETSSLHCESDIFYDKKRVYKILDEPFRDRESIVEELCKEKLSNTIVPKEMLVEGSMFSHRFVGYSMDYYKDYVELYSLFNYNLPLEKRKELIVKINSAYRNMIDKGYRYWDLRQGNILSNGKDIVYADMDSIRRLFDRGRYTDMFAREGLFVASLSLLLNQEYSKIIYDENLKQKDIKKIYSFIDSLTPDKDVRAVLKSIYQTHMRTSLDMKSISDVELANMMSASCYFDEIQSTFTEDSINTSLKLVK